LIEEGLLDNARARGEQAKTKLAAMAERHPSIGEVRGHGLMIGVELVKDRATKERAPELRDAVAKAAFEHGLLLLGCGRNSIRLIPPLVVTAAEIDEGLEILDACLTLAEDRHLATA